MNNNVSKSSLKRMLKSKGFVTGLCALLAVLVLVVGYNLRVNNATKPVRVPVAAARLSPRHQITSEDIVYVSIPRDAIASSYYAHDMDIIGRYVNYDTTIPQGSMFYDGAIVDREDLPDESLFGVDEGETLYYLTVNMLTSYTNSILPNRYIDIYISTKMNGKALVGKLLENVKVLQVKTADGRNVFDDSQQSNSPYVILFSLPEEQHLLMRKISAINAYSISGTSGFSRIDVIPVPTTAYFKEGDKKVPSTIASEFLQEHILNLAETIPEDIKVPTGNEIIGQ